jgi:hypothetical protein
MPPGQTHPTDHNQEMVADQCQDGNKERIPHTQRLRCQGLCLQPPMPAKVNQIPNTWSLGLRERVLTLGKMEIFLRRRRGSKDIPPGGLSGGYLIIAYVWRRTRRIGVYTRFARWIQFGLALYIPLMIAKDAFEFVSSATLLSPLSSMALGLPSILYAGAPKIFQISSQYVDNDLSRSLVVRHNADSLKTTAISSIRCRCLPTCQMPSTYKYPTPQHLPIQSLCEDPGEVAW